MNETLLIYQMGRVGSVALRTALREKKLNPIHVHYLLSFGEFSVRQKPELLQKITTTTEQIDVITIVREPIARNLSAFFRPVNPTEFDDKYSDKLLAAFLRRYNPIWPLIWFDLELNPLFEIDIYKRPFDHKKGYSIYEYPHIRLLVLKNERFRQAPAAIKEFLGVDIEKVPLRNATRQRPNYVKLYEETLREIELPKDYVKLLYSSKYARHFYRKGELLRLTQHWTNRSYRANYYLSNG